MMRRVKIRTVKDMMALPEGEWVEVPEGLDLEVVYDEKITVDHHRIIVPLPAGVARRFTKPPNGNLRARVSNGKLIVELPKAKKGRRASKRLQPG